MLLKNLPKNQLFKIIFIRLVLDGIAGVQFIVKGKFKHCFAIVKAHYSFFGLISRNLKKRNAIQKQNYYHTKSIVHRYFVKNGKVFE
jgi:hypothetical protein